MREIWFALGVGAVCIASAAACGSDDAGSGPNGGSDAGADAPPLYTGGACPDVGLPNAGALRNVRAQANGGSVRVDYDLFDGAKDYRVYALPAKGATAADGTNTTAVYRCAGNRQVPEAITEDGKLPQSYAVHTRVASKVAGFARTLDGATLGHVYTTPGAGRVPVYALGDSDKDADNSCYFQRWTESRVKVYTTSEDERKALLAKRFRDDGIAFYAVAPGSPDSVVINAATGDSAKLYVAAGTPEAGSRKGAAPAFSARIKPDGDTQPLMRVFYENDCGTSHDELVAGKGKFERAYHQGPTQPHDVLHWSGVEGPMTLVVEALDDLCPFQGVLSPTSRPAKDDDGVKYPAYVTPDEARAASPTHELFVGGQGDGTKPKVLARSCVDVKPRELEKLDFAFPAGGEVFTPPVEAGFQIWRFESPSFAVHQMNAGTDEWAVGSLFGELWTPHSDWAADTNGKVRFTAKPPAQLSADKFVKVTMQVDAVSTGRRYPQILVSDVGIPVQDNLKNGTTIIVQTIETGVTNLEVQLCDHREWDVNDQCPRWDLYNLDAGGTKFLAPNVEVASVTGLDRTNFFEVYVSTARVYVMLDNQPYGCVNLPAGKLPAGPGTVTFGDVLYHSSADLEPWQPFMMSKYQLATSRHFSNLAFGSNRPAPAWDETRFPCVSGPPNQP
ncbi:MAG: hypothetical protein JWM74_1451 [Myxococcaceae bacterium]|nr:hypothetical protein [Myxococcaceae bacterium]